MANNILANTHVVVVAKESITFAAAGLSETNIRIIYKINSVLQSWRPEREINGIHGFQQNWAYYIVSKQDIDLSAIVVPPLDVIIPEFDINSIEKVAWYDVTDAGNREVTTGTVTKLIDKSGNGYDMESSTIDFPTFSAAGGANNMPFMTIEEGGKNMYVDGLTSTGGVVTYMLMRYKNFTRTDVPGQGTIKTVLSYDNRINGLILDDATVGYMPQIDLLGGRNSGVYENTKNTNWQLVVLNGKSVSSQLVANMEPYPTCCVNELALLGVGNLHLGYYSLSANFEIAELMVVDTLTITDDKNIRQYFLEKYSITPKNYIIYFGDSLSHGTCSEVMHYYLTTSENGMNLINYAQGGSIVFPNNGSTGIAGKNFVDVYQKPMPFANTNCWLSFAFGVNDINQGGVNSAWKAGYKGYLQEFINAGYNPEHMIIWKQPATSVRQATMAPAWNYIEEIADELGIILYDANARFLANGGDSLFGDTLHPGTNGNRIEADGMNEIIEA